MTQFLLQFTVALADNKKVWREPQTETFYIGPYSEDGMDAVREDIHIDLEYLEAGKKWPDFFCVVFDVIEEKKRSHNKVVLPPLDNPEEFVRGLFQFTLEIFGVDTLDQAPG